MNALDVDPDLYDRLEALGEWHALTGIPEPSDDEYWDGVLAPSNPAREE
jgi:hypothetical protein